TKKKIRAQESSVRRHVNELVREGALVELYLHAAGIERVDGARLTAFVLHAVQQPVAITGQLQVRHCGVLQLNAGHVLVDAFKQRQKRMVLLFFLVIAVDLVEPELDIRDFACDGVDGRERPTVKVAHRLRGIDGFSTGRPVDRERVAATEGLFIRGRYFGFARTAAVAKNDGAAGGKTFK